MSVSYDVQTTSNSADIIIYDIYRIPSGNTITLQTFLNNNFVEWVNDIDISWLINYTYTFSGLSPNTTYTFDIDFWEDRDVVDTIHASFTTDSGGGGGGGGNTPEFAVTNYTSSSVTIEVYDASGYWFSYYLRDVDSGTTVFDGEGGDGRTRTNPFTINGLSPSTNYAVWVAIADYSTGSSGYEDINSANSGTAREDFTTLSGGGSQTWNIDDNFPVRYVDNGHQIQFYAGDIGYYYLLSIPMYFDVAGTYTIEASSSESLYAYLSTSSYWNDTYGEPDSYYVVGQDTSSSNGFSFTATVNDSSLYYLYLRTRTGNSNSYNFLVEFSTSGGGGGGTWQLISDDKGTLSSSQTYTLSGGMVANRLYSYAFVFSTACTVTFSSSSSADLFGWLSDYNQTTWGNNSQGVPDQYVPDNFLDYNDDIDRNNGNNDFSITYSCQANRVYYLWFRQYSGYAVQNSVTISITISSVPLYWEDDATINLGTLSSTDTDSYSVSQKHLKKILFQCTRAGTLTVTSTGGTDIMAYITYDTNYNQSTGVPTGTQLALSGNDGSSSTNVNFTATISANTAYYLWIRGRTESDSGSFALSVSPPTGGSVSGDGQTYIFYSGAWHEATPYIYINGSWVEAKPGIYVNGSWI